jgi:hypothetical protein
MKIEVGRKYTDGSLILEVKFFDYEGIAWCLTDKKRLHYILKQQFFRWTEVIEKPDPGEGWRLLHSDEDLEAGDEFWSQSEQTWIPSLQSQTIQLCGWYYRRRIAPQYVPYTWDDREELRGKWYRNKETKLEAMVYYFSPLGSDFRINSYCPEMFLELCEWLDGSPCGKRVV